MTLRQTAGNLGAPPLASRVSFFGASDVGKVRRNNEDAFVIDAARGLCVVADGMGGLNRGEVASRVVVDSVAEAVQKGLSAADGLRMSHARVRRMIDGAGEERMGATAVALAVAGARGRIVWVGDSRAYLWRAGALQQLTKDHSFVQELMDLGLINRDEASAHPNRSVVTRAVGVRELDQIKVDETAVDLQPGDRVLLCTDGLSGFLPEAALVEELAAGRDDTATVNRLIQRTLAETEAADNVTAVLATVQD